MGKASRTKGKNYELEIRKALWPFWTDVRRNLKQYQETDGRDFDNTEPLCIQAKRRKRVTMGVVEQGLVEAYVACDDTYRYPVVVFRSDNGRSKVLMELEHFVEWLCLMEDGQL